MTRHPNHQGRRSQLQGCNKSTPRVTTPLATITNATIDKPIQTNTPNPKANIETRREPLFEQTKLSQKIRDVRNQRAQITQQTHIQLRQQEQHERIQLVRDNDTGEYLNYRQLIQNPKHQKIWNTSAENEFGQLAQGVGGRVKATNTIFFIPKDKVPKDRMKDVTYGSISCNIKPNKDNIKSNKEETHQTRLTAGGDRINYLKDVGTPTADMTLVKTLLNSIISTKGAKCVILDIKDFYLNTPTKQYKYMRLKLSVISEKILIEYKLCEIATLDGYVYCKIRKGMFGLPQVGIIAQELLQECLAKVGYHQSKIVPGLWTHEMRNTCFTLVVDNFAIKYTNMEDAKQLIDALQKDYTITVDWNATKYIGITIEWDYKTQKVYTHMPGYLSKALLLFKHDVPKTKQNSPHPHVAPHYGAKEQYTTEEDTSPLLNKEEAKYVQAVAGTLLYYARAVEYTILPALSAITTKQAKPTEKTKATIKQLLDYCAMQEEPVIAYKASKNDPCGTQQSLILQRKEFTKPSGRTFFPIK